MSASLDWTIPQKLGIPVERNRLLAPLTTMKVGGPADYLATVKTVDQLLKLVRWARASDLPYYILGGSSNVLISDRGIRGLVIFNRCRAIRVDDPPCCDYPQDQRPFLFAESGAALAGAARTSIQSGLSGLEWAVSVPGTVGGAVLGNAGAHGGEVKDNLWNVQLLDEEGDWQELDVEQMAYAYRDSALKRLHPVQAAFKPVILSANFRLHPADPSQPEEANAIRERADRYLQHRRATQPVEPSLGSTFKNPPGDFAGRLIDAAGLKGHTMGGAVVSSLHANFILNPAGVGGASAADVAAMIDSIQERVQEQFGVTLIPEILFVGEWPE